MAANIPREFIDLVLAKIDIVDLINTHIPLKKKSGSNYFARCPFHNEKSASFSVSQPKQFYYCFGCGAHGNAIDFLMHHDHLNFPEAIENLAHQAGMELPKNTESYVKKDDSLATLFQLMVDATDYFYENMRNSERAIQYFKNRGISGVIAKQFFLGYAPNGWNNLIDKFVKTESDKLKLLEAGLVIKKEDSSGYYDRFRDRVMFPIHDYRGRVIGFGGRVIDQGEPKYLNSPETPLFQKGHELYGLYQALKINRKLDRVIMVEGYMDVIALFQSGITYAVATLGTATTPHHFQRLFRYTSDIIFCFDGDAAGRTAAWRALQVLFPLMHDSLQIRFLFLPDGEDPDSLVRKIGKEAFEQLYTTSPSLSDFFFQTLSKQCDLSSMEGRARFAALALEHIKQLPPSIYQDILIDELGKRARISIRDFKIAHSHAQETPTKENKAKSQLPANVRLALALLIQSPELASLITEPLPSSPLVGFSFMLNLIELIHEKPNVTTASLIEHYRGEKEEDFIRKLAQFEHGIPDAGVKNEFLGIIRQLITMTYDLEIDHFLSKAAHEPLADQEKSELSKLISQKKALTNPA